jgi:hypothetical protein
MKVLNILFLCALLLQNQAKAQIAQTDDPNDSRLQEGALAEPSPKATPTDLILQTRTDAKTTNWIIEKTRVLLANDSIDDHLSGTVPIDPIPLISLQSLEDAPNYAKLRDIMASVFNIDLKDAALRVTIPSISYKVDKILAQPLDMQAQDPVLRLHTKGGVQGLYVNLGQGLTLDFVIPNAKTKKYDSYLTAVVDQVSVEVPKTLPALPLELTLEATRDTEFKYKLISSNLDSIPDYVSRYQSSFLLKSGSKDISVNNVRVNPTYPVVISLNHMKRIITFDEFKPVVQKALPEIMKFVLNQVGTVLKTSLGPDILATTFSSTTPASLSTSTPFIFTQFGVSKFTQPMPDQLSLKVDGSLCTEKDHKQFGDLCSAHETKVEPVRAISDAEQQMALDEITESISNHTADTVLSVSEEYMNRLLRTTIDADLWNDSLAKNHLHVGPKGIFLVFNEKTKTPQIYMDCLYSGTGKGIQSWVVNDKNMLRFPLRISTSLKFENRNGIPYLVITTDELLTDEDEIRNGIEAYDMDSKLVIGFKHKIAKTILAMRSTIENQVAVELDLPMFKNVDLETSSYETSAHGRLNLSFKL